MDKMFKLSLMKLQNCTKNKFIKIMIISFMVNKILKYLIINIYMENKKVVKAKPSFLKNIGMAGGAAVITVTFIHPIDVIKTRL